jgi:limonene-1,2-epoxide hydrolase
MTTAERLTMMETNQKNMKETVDEMKAIQKEQSEDIKAILERLDSLTGGKTALMWVTGIFLTVCGLALAFFNSLRHQ